MTNAAQPRWLGAGHPADRRDGLTRTGFRRTSPTWQVTWHSELGCPAIDRGTNQPNVFFDPKSSESFTPHFSRGWRDDAIQRAYLEAIYLWWGEAANNPVSSVYGGRMVHVPECAAWTWDARPYPFFPALTDVWADGANWRLGHWLTGRLGAVSLAALVRHLCLRAEMPESRIDVSGLWGAVEGYAITALESPRASITTLARHFGFDAVETEGVIRFVMRGRASVATLASDDLVAAREGDVLELTRGQETELPQALKWQVARADEDYDAALVEARRITVDTTRIASESFPMAVPPEEAERRCRRALMEAWVGRETAAFRLPPSRLALDPADAIRLEHDGRLVALRLVSIADAEARGIEAVRQDRATYNLPPGDPRAASLTRAVVFGAPDAVLMDLPQLTEDQPAHRPFVAAHAVPWPGEMGVPQPVDRWLRVVDHGSVPRPDRGAGLGLPRGPQLALRLRQCACGRLADRHAGKRHRPDAVRRGERARYREHVRRLGDRAGGRGRTACARPVSPDPAPARPARHRGCHGQSGACGRASGGARRKPRIPPTRRGRSWHPVELAHRPREPSGQRRDLRRARLHACRRRAADVLRRSCRAAVASPTHARRPDDPLDAPVARTFRRQLGWARGAAGRGTGSLRGGDPRRRHCEAGAEHGHHQRGLHRRPADRRLGRATRPRRHARHPHLPALRPCRAGCAQGCNAELLR
ncbi:glycoside hydrolase TIM-barrel-like domain-containing protein [Martelella mediterranea]|nr:glycoside hydrolase TIM-barrel-like domain-containing protein [Martelella mediterranea]